MAGPGRRRVKSHGKSHVQRGVLLLLRRAESDGIIRRQGRRGYKADLARNVARIPGRSHDRDVVLPGRKMAKVIRAEIVGNSRAPAENRALTGLQPRLE